MPRAAPSSVLDLSSHALALHLARTADVAAAEGCRTAAEKLVWAVYAAFSAEPSPCEPPAGIGMRRLDRLSPAPLRREFSNDALPPVRAPA